MSGAFGLRVVRRGLLLAALLSGGGPAGCGGGTELAEEAGQPVWIRVEAGASTVEFGRAFPLTVVRSWSEDLVPEAWSDRQLAPLVVKPAGTEQRRRGGRVVETRRFDAYAFVSGPLRLERVALRARPLVGGGGPESERSAVAGLLELEVRPAILDEDDGAAEFPDGPLAPADRRWWWKPGLAAVLVALVLLILKRRAAGSGGSSSSSRAPGLSARDRAAREALDALDHLRALEPAAAAAFDRDAVLIASLLRGFLARAFDLPGPRRTTEELLGLSRARFGDAAPCLAPLAACLAYCDREKFGPPAALLAARARALAEAVRFVEAAL